MTVEQLLQLAPFSSLLLGIAWYIRTRYGPVLRARAARDAEQITDGTKR